MWEISAPIAVPQRHRRQKDGRWCPQAGDAALFAALKDNLKPSPNLKGAGLGPVVGNLPNSPLGQHKLSAALA